MQRCRRGGHTAAQLWHKTPCQSPGRGVGFVASLTNLTGRFGMSISVMGRTDSEGHDPPTPFRQIRACLDEETIAVYQAYTSTIATAAVEAQRLDASPSLKLGRTTWHVKPSWAWMLYRAGHSFKDVGQERILALKMRHGDFVGLLRKGVLTLAETAAG
ncbi:hypothetical protein LZ30DRAFT_711447 [Colletotrichum cereale]|nr:hypothetical protein LZ30DRAFT_711447 [Colletotrichum cereale]